MKVMPFLSLMKYGWHYSNAVLEMLRLLQPELFLYPLKGHRLKNVCLCLRTHVHRYNEHRILPYKIHSNPHHCRVWTIPRGSRLSARSALPASPEVATGDPRPLNTPLSTKED